MGNLFSASPPPVPDPPDEDKILQEQQEQKQQSIYRFLQRINADRTGVKALKSTSAFEK